MLQTNLFCVMKYYYSLVELKAFTSAGCEARSSSCIFSIFVGFLSVTFVLYAGD